MKKIKIPKLKNKNAIKKAYKFRFYPQDDWKVILAKTFGCTRFVFNQTLNYSITNYSIKFLDIDKKNINPDYKNITSTDRINYLIELKKQFDWLSEVSSIALQQSIRNLNTSYDRFFKQQSAFPQYKKKFNRNSFTITGKNSIHFQLKNKLDINNKKLSIDNFEYYLPKYDKPLDIRFSRSFNHLAVSSVTISQEPSGKYFISFLVEEEITTIVPTNQKTSIDLGLKTNAKIYDGISFKDYNLPELLTVINKKINKSQRELSRKTKGSKRRNKNRIQLATLYEKKSNITKDFYHKLSSNIVNNNQEIMIEDLAVNNMIKNRKLSKAIHDVAWSNFNSMLQYKSTWQNRKLVKANRFYPSSKTCSCCHNINNSLSLKNRTWVCSSCNTSHDRDENACINLFNYDEKLYTKINKQLVGTTSRGGNVSPESSRLSVTKKTMAVACETEKESSLLRAR